jgi:CheY-like chemotaxis protein
MAHILLIDDDELLRDTLLQMLELDGHRVTEAASGEEALKLLGSGSGFDLVLTDVLMPGIDGARVIVEVHKRRPGLPVVAMSGGRRMLSPQFNLQTALLAGARAQLSKPFNRQELQSALSDALTAQAPR